jgi:hypothetical protein
MSNIRKSTITTEASLYSPWLVVVSLELNGILEALLPLAAHFCRWVSLRR